jgi:ligand-binding sensor domain-containing protein/signal transduction histidine kinase
MTQYSHSSWTRQEDRLPGAITALAQTRDGAMWIGTELGLLRFDGVRFTPWQAPVGHSLPSDTITTLLAANDGTLWIGTRDGLSHWANGELINYETSPASPSSPTGPRPAPRTIMESQDHTIWVGFIGYGSGGLCRVDGKKLNCDNASAVASPGVGSIFQDRSGNLWVGRPGSLSYSNHGTVHAYPLRPVDMVTSIAEDRRGQVWLTTSSAGGLLRCEDGKLVPKTLLPPGQLFLPLALLSDRDGGLWIGTLGQGLFHLHEGRSDQFTHSDGLSSDVVRALLEDHEGNVWAATTNGLDRFREFPVTTLNKREGLAQDMVTSLFAAASGGIWIGTTGGVNRADGNSISPFDRRQGAPSGSINGLFEELAGGLWVASSSGLAFGEPTRFQPMDRSLPQRFRSFIAAAQNGQDIWFSEPEQGLLRFHGHKIAEAQPWSQFHNQRAWAIEAGHEEGEVWLGFSPGGLAHWKNGNITRWYGPNDGLPQGTVVDLHLDRKGTLWIATQNGLSRLSGGHISTLTKANGLPCEHIQAMLEDDGGSLWLNTPCGAVRLTADDLAAWSVDPARRVRPALYDVSDGMQSNSGALGYSRHAAKSTDGRLWFAVGDGVAVIDPKHLPKNELPPPVTIEKITADQKDYAVNSQPHLPPKTKDLEIDYTAFSFVAPDKVVFRYRLEGMESDWHTSNHRQATYTNLAPGNYRFQVIASNNDGVWNNAGASLNFSVLPAFYQTVWFEPLCAALAILVLWCLYRLRLRQLRAQLKLRFDARLAERTRIANQLHEDLLQSIPGFSLQLDGLFKIVSDTERAKEMIRDLREQSDQWLHETRETVWDIRSPSLDDRSFLEALRDTAERIAKGKRVQVEIMVTGDHRPLPPNVAGRLLRITREATRNAIRHSNAGVIKLQVAFMEHNMLQVMIVDNGCGFDLEEGSRKMKHWGLAAMQDLGREIGAELKINTAPGEGTAIVIRVRTDPASR